MILPPIDIETVLTPRVLLIDDDASIRRLFEFRLSRMGLKVICAATASEGMNLARSEKPTLILLDVHLGSASGIELCQQLKATAETALIPILLLTGDTGVEPRLQGLRAGASDFIAKSFDPESIGQRVHGAIENFRRRLALESGSRPSPLRVLGSLADLDARLVTTGRGGTALLLNLNGFRKINEAHGHEVGDAVLRGWGKALAAVAEENAGTRLAHLVNDSVLVCLAARSAERTAQIVARFSAAAGEVHLRKEGRALDAITSRHVSTQIEADGLPSAVALAAQLQRELRMKSVPGRKLSRP